MIKIIKENGKLKVRCDFNREWIKKAKETQGHWENPYWVFPEENEEIVRNILKDVFGEDDTPGEKVTVDLDLDQYRYGNNLMIASILIASRPAREAAVKLSENALVLKGGFEARGGSTRTPRVTHEEGTVVRVKELPVLLYEKIKDLPGVSLVEASETETVKEKVNLRIRIEDGKTYVSLNHGEWLVNKWNELTEDMKIVLNVLCSMNQFDVTIDAKKE